IDSSAAEQARIGGVHERIDALRRDVTRDEFQAWHPLGYPRLFESSKMRSSSATAPSRSSPPASYMSVTCVRRWFSTSSLFSDPSDFCTASDRVMMSTQ